MSNKTLLDQLAALDALFCDESKWTRGAFGRTASGDSCTSWDSFAVCWCLSGGINRVCRNTSDALPAAQTAERELRGALLIDEPILGWNDSPSRTFADIKKLIADTRERLQAEESK